MRVIIDNTEKLTKLTAIIALLKNYSENIQLNFKKNCLYIQGMDNTHSCLYEVNLFQDWFDFYEANETVLSLRISLFHLLISKNTNSKLTINYDEINQEDKIQIIFEDKKINSMTTTFDLPLIDLDIDYLTIPKQVYNYTFIMDTKMFSEKLENLLIFDSDVLLKCQKNKLFSLGSKNTETGANMELNIDLTLIKNCDEKPEITEAQAEQNLKLKSKENGFIVDYFSNINTEEDNEDLNIYFSNKILTKCCLTTKITDIVYMSLSNNTPMFVEYLLSDTSAVRCFIAPKIDD